jgi:hypothetical protein
MSRQLESLKSFTPPASLASRRSMLQRSCDCGNHTIGGAQCEECRKGGGGILQRAPAGTAAAPAAQNLSQVPASANLTMDQKVEACKELLKGATTRRDEMKILDLLRTSTLEERLEIARRIGRERLVADFSFRRRKSVEALTLDLDDFKALHTDTVKEYQEGVLPEDKPYIDNLVNLLEFSTPLDPTKAQVPKSVAAQGMPAKLVAELTAKGADFKRLKETKLVVKGIDVTVLSDITDTALSLRGETTIAVDPGTPKTPRVSVTIYTAYASNITPKFSPTDYGTGTTTTDQQAGRTSLRYHEGTHGRKALEYLAANPPPRFSAFYNPASPDKGFALYQQAVQAYEAALRQQNLADVDCAPGSTKKQGCPP